MARRSSSLIAAPSLPAQLDRWSDAIGDGDDLVSCELTSDAIFSSSIELLDITDCRVHRARLTGVAVNRLVLRNVAFVDVEASGLALTSTRWTRVSVAGSRFSGINAPAAKFEDVVFRHCVMNDASFGGATFERVAFVDCDLTGADWSQTTMQSCAFVRCELERADFTKARMQQVSFPGCTLTDVKGVAGLSGGVIDSVQALSVAQAALAALGIAVRDDDGLASQLLGPGRR
jgi:uncharacterized protein YjbI with pentapeptide repeats